MKNTLETVLATTFCLMHKTQDAHWNVTGHAFYALHDMFGSQYDDLSTMVDDTAEIIRAQGHTAVAGLSEYSAMSKVTSKLSSHDTNAMLTELIADYTVLTELMEQALDEASTDVRNFFEDRIQAHAKHQWMLSASLSK